MALCCNACHKVSGHDLGKLKGNYTTKIIHRVQLIIFFLWRCDPSRVMASSFLRFLDHTHRCITVGRTHLDEWLIHRRDLYLTTHNTHNRQTSIPPVGFEPTISAGERPQTYALDRAATGISMHHRIQHGNNNKSNTTLTHATRSLNWEWRFEIFGTNSEVGIPYLICRTAWRRDYILWDLMAWLNCNQKSEAGSNLV
jgi:hypothetical protein